MSPAAIVPQRCVLVLPSTAEFDSRTYRIASTLSARGHDVTVMARLAPGLPASEVHPSGYRVLRVPVSAAAGLPGPLRGLGRLVSGRSRSAGEAAPGAVPNRGATPARPARRRAGGLDRLAAIALTVRSQRGETHRLAPPADLVHAMAYMGIPVGLDLGRRDGAPVIYDARDIYVDAANLARLPGPARRLFARIERGWARRAQRVMTVNRPYADVMSERFGVPLPVIVLNCAYRSDPPDSRPRRFHDRLGLDPTTPVVLYQGG
ncbi:MAG TPA: glycosyltransferase, partial [Candidatus Limnocylindrales bacterium]